jgi:hypothetical protein
VPSRCTCSSIFGYGIIAATLAARSGVEAEVLRHVPLPISAAVATGPDVEDELLVLLLEPVSKYGVCGAEGIVSAKSIRPGCRRAPARRGDRPFPSGVVVNARAMAEALHATPANGRRPRRNEGLTRRAAQRTKPPIGIPPIATFRACAREP